MTTQPQRAQTQDYYVGDLLTPEWEEALGFAAMDGDDGARRELVERHIPLANKRARKYAGYGLDPEDLANTAVIGLIQASHQFDPRKARFSTYARWWIDAAIRDHILATWDPVKHSSSTAAKKLFFKYRSERDKLNKLIAGLSRDELHKRISENLYVPIREVDAAELRLSGGVVSLNAPVSEGGDEYISMLPSHGPSPEEEVANQEASTFYVVLVRKAMEKLTERERDIITAREMAHKDDVVTLDSLGEKYGVTRERVRQIEKKAKEKLESEIGRLMRDKGGEMGLRSMLRAAA